MGIHDIMLRMQMPTRIAPPCEHVARCSRFVHQAHMDSDMMVMLSVSVFNVGDGSAGPSWYICFLFCYQVLMRHL